MNETLDALFQLNENTVLHEAGDFAVNDTSRRIVVIHSRPGIGSFLLETQRDTILIHFQNEDLDIIAHSDHFPGMPHMGPGHVVDVQKPIEPAEVNESPEVGEVLNDALDPDALFDLGQRLLAIADPLFVEVLAL